MFGKLVHKILRKVKKSWVVYSLGSLLIFSNYAQSQLWSGILASDRAIDWSSAGAGTIPNRTTICSTLTSSATASQINTAITNCPQNQVVSLGAGTYSLSAGILFQRTTGMVIRGAGPEDSTGTVLNFTGTNSCGGLTSNVCIKAPNVNDLDSPGNVHNWTANFAKGTAQIQLDSVANLQVGSIMVLDQLDSVGADNLNIWIGDTPGTHCLDCASPSRGGNRAQSQVVQVTAINGTLVTIDPPVIWPQFDLSRTPQVWYPTNGAAISGIGIEDLQITGPDTGAAILQTVAFYNAAGNWLKNVKLKHVGEKGIRLYQSTHNSILGFYMWDKRGPDSGQEGSESYGVDPYIGSMNLIMNGTVHHITSPFQCESGQGNVYAYLFSFDDFYNQSNPDWFQASDYTHGVCAYNLREGNIGAGFIADPVHSGNFLQSLYRDRYRGIDPEHLPLLALQTVPVHIYAVNRFNNIFLSILGDKDYHTKYESLATGGSANCDTSIFAIGFGGNCSNSGGVPSKADTATTTARCGNWDTVTSTNDTGTNDSTGTRFITSEDGHTALFYPAITCTNQSFPASFFLSSKPSWFGSIPWPPIGPDVANGNITGVGGHANKNPAEVCWEGGTHDGNDVRTDWNSTTCAGGSPPVQPPHGLAIIVGKLKWPLL